MKTFSLHLSPLFCKRNTTTSLLFCGVVFLSAIFSYAQESNKIVQKTDDVLLDEYIASKGSGIISFDASNIKQFWIDNSVVSRNSSFEIILKSTNNQSFESVPLKIQLANVNEAMDCTIEVIADTEEYFFSVCSIAHAVESARCCISWRNKKTSTVVSKPFFPNRILEIKSFEC